MRLPYKLGRYTLVERIAAGGTAEVYRAVFSGQSGFAKTVAIKRLLPSWGGNDEVEAMLVDEALALTRLQHDSIVQVFELGMCEGAPFIAMEHVDGIDCSELLTKLIREEKPLSPALALYIADRTLSALEFAHRSLDSEGKPMGMVHRDVSPPNILLSWRGEVKVADFGIAKGSHRTRRTQLGQLKGKYSYMSPEQARGEAIDLRADIYACGIVLCELLMARRLFEGGSDFEVLEKVRSANGPPKEISALPPELRVVLMLAMAADPSRRYQSAAEMSLDVLRCSSCVGGQASGREMASFLRELFPREDPARFVSAMALATDAGQRTMPLESAPPRRMRLFWKGLMRAAGALAMIALLSTAPPAKEGIAVAKAKPQAQTVETSQAHPATPPASSRMMPRRGAIAIDSLPSGARGILVLDGAERQVTTPFAMEGIDVQEAVSGRVEIAAPGFRRKSEEFELGPLRPAFVKKFELERIAPSAISVHARPWGLVDVSGVASARETPVSKLKLKAGVYSVTVRHPPSGGIVTARVALSEGQSRNCTAVFEGRPSLICR